MTVKTKLTGKDFINASFTVIFNRRFTRYFVIAVCSIILINAVLSGDPLSGLVPPLIIFVLFSLVMYFSLKRAEKKNERAGENIEYSFEQNNLVIKGESFKSELSWNKIPKVTQTKNWLLIWQNSQVANPIPKRDISEGVLAELKRVLNSNQVKNNL